MKFLSILGLGAAVIAALPADVESRDLKSIETRATTSTSTRNELENGDSSSCPKVIFIYARASTEDGNMGEGVGPNVANGLTTQYGSANIWVQGVGSPYEATIRNAMLSSGTDEASINEGIRMFTMANEKCPNAAVVCGGYSQGSAVISNAVSRLGSTITSQLKGAVLFGYTQNKQNNGRIPNYPQDQTKIFCNTGDLVCSGTLIVTAAHYQYRSVAATEAPQFLISKIGTV